MSLAHELHAAHKARLARMSGRPVIAPPPVVVPPPTPKPDPITPLTKPRRSYETISTLGNYVPLSYRIMTAVADEFGLTVKEMISPKRSPKYLIPRYVAIALLDEMTDMSLPAIGRRMGGRDHTTIINARRRAEKLFESEAFRNRVDQIMASVLA